MNSIKLVGCCLFILKICTDEVASGFDTWTFVQRWPKTMCPENTEAGRRRCQIPANVTSWIIHGLWPNGPTYCHNSSAFSPKSVETIRKDLVKYWPSLFTGFPCDKFWAYEWKRHGTCAVPVLKGQLEYFRKALELRQKYNIDDALKKSKILPSNERTYKFGEIYRAVEASVHTKGPGPEVMCAIDKENGKQFLAEIRICLEKSSYEVVKCPNRLRGNKIGFHSLDVDRMHQGMPTDGDSKGGVTRKIDPDLSFCRKNLEIIYPEMKNEIS